jgi:hypothetical protein
MPIALSAFVLRSRDRDRLARAASQFHQLFETLLDYLLARRDRFDRYSPDHARMFPYLRRCVGSSTWQLFSRYDMVVSPEGDVYFIEGNTGCPAGFMHAIDFSVETRRVLDALGIVPRTSMDLGMIRPDALVELILRTEARSGLPPGLVAILTDENQLQLELDLIEAGLRDAGRQARIIDARTLSFDGQTLSHHGERISTLFNKIRISTPASPNHCWRDGFEERYAALLAAIQKGVVVSINSLAALSVAEDKGMLAHLHDPSVREILSPSDRDFIDDTIPWTTRLLPRRVCRHGEWLDPVEYVRAHRESFVIKPAHEGRGYGVAIGRETSPADWATLCQPREDMPLVAQEFVEPMSLPVHCLRQGTISLETMHVTLALAVLEGRYEGILSRISPSLVTNVGRQGFVQAVFVESESP